MVVFINCSYIVFKTCILNKTVYRSEDLQSIEEDEPTNIQCGMCSDIFPNKEKFMEHSMEVNGFYTCCRCQAKFRSSQRLYNHYDSHRGADALEIQNDSEEVLIDFEGNEEIIVQPSINENNELLYILDDSACVNEVVIEEDDAVNSNIGSKHNRDTQGIISLEHGYVMQTNVENYIEEEMEDEDGNIVIARRLATPSKPTTSKKIFTQSKPRAPQPKRRHEVPDFSATNYVYMNPTSEIEVPHYKCLRCEQLFINKFVFFRHIEKGKCFINNCDVCSSSFTKNSAFYKHYIAEHTDRAICNFCFRTFMYEKNVKEHMMRHLDQFRHRCEDCNKGFYTVREYRNHYKNRHMGIRHKCDVCGRSFADEYYFKRHIATHAKANNIAVLKINN